MPASEVMRHKRVCECNDPHAEPSSVVQVEVGSRDMGAEFAICSLVEEAPRIAPGGCATDPGTESVVAKCVADKRDPTAYEKSVQHCRSAGSGYCCRSTMLHGCVHH